MEIILLFINIIATCFLFEQIRQNNKFIKSIKNIELENLQKFVINIEERIFSTRYADNDKVNDLQNHFRRIQEEFDVFKNQINYISNTVESIDRILIKEISKRDGSI